LAAIGEIGLVGEHQEVAIGQRQRRTSIPLYVIIRFLLTIEPQPG
jgi:hypothetical protein